MARRFYEGLEDNAEYYGFDNKYKYDKFIDIEKLIVDKGIKYDDHFYSAQGLRDFAKERIDDQDYEGALEVIGNLNANDLVDYFRYDFMTGTVKPIDSVDDLKQAFPEYFDKRKMKKLRQVNYNESRKRAYGRKINESTPFNHQFLDLLERTALKYERGRMLRDDSEVEIDILEDNNGELYVWVCDYSESRGGSEPVKKVCPAYVVNEDDVIDLCDKYGWYYQL